MNVKSIQRYGEHLGEQISDRIGDVSDVEAARGLGWASLAVGLTELVIPRQIERLMGIGNGENTGILRMLGVRELMHGMDILTHDDPTNGVVSRVAGDALDGVCLAAAATRTRKPGGFMTVVALVLPLVILDVIFAERLTRRRRRS